MLWVLIGVGVWLWFLLVVSGVLYNRPKRRFEEQAPAFNGRWARVREQEAGRRRSAA